MYMMRAFGNGEENGAKNLLACTSPGPARKHAPRRPHSTAVCSTLYIPNIPAGTPASVRNRQVEVPSTHASLPGFARAREDQLVGMVGKLIRRPARPGGRKEGEEEKKKRTDQLIGCCQFLLVDCLESRRQAVSFTLAVLQGWMDG